ncbi:MAG: 6-phosphogluconolactonase [Deltaproteobacteria bacterium]|nr:6-phosphogluconolactonase [Deltaproteobacteria bacterium]
MSAPAAWREHADRDGWARALALQLEAELRRGLDSAGRATLVACGGSTPDPVYAALARANLNWRRVSVLPSDERWVPATSPHSNAALLARNFGAAGAQLISLHTRGADPFDAAAELCARAAAALPFDAALLGMGPDGHTLSWFAGARGLKTALRGADAADSALVAAIHAGESPVAAPVPLRVTLTFAALMQTRRIFIAITGSEKRAVALRALEQSATPEGSARTAGHARTALPICALLCQRRVPVELHWAA